MTTTIVFLITFLAFLLGTIFFLFNKPRIIEKWQAILISIFGTIVYGILLGGCIIIQFG